MMANCMLGYLILSVFMLGLVELKECGQKALRLRDDDGLPYYYFQGTSYNPEIMNKHINKNTPGGATWCPEKNKVEGSFLEVDLGKQYSLCGVSTQGDNTHGFTESYKIELSSDRIEWKFFQNNGTDMIFEGNNDSTTIVTHPLNSTETARFVRFYPITYDTNACIRVELYGQEIVKKRCEKTAIDANSPHVVITSRPKIPPSENLSILNGTQPWCWSSNSTEPYLKVDFGAYSVVCALQFNFSGILETSFGNESLDVKSLKISGSQLYIPEDKILTTFLQFKPIGNSSCLFVKIFGYLNEELINEDIGFQYGNSSTFPDESLATSQSQFHIVNANPRDGRLYKPWDYWCPYDIVEPFYIELILVRKYYIFAVSFQGKATPNIGFTKDFSVSYSDDYANWEEDYTKYRISFNRIIKKHSLAKPIQARILRVNLAAELSGTLPCLKVELHGILIEESAAYCKKPHPLGLSSQVKDIPDESITVSSELIDVRPKYNHARLRDSNFWCAKNLPNQTISVDLRQFVSISGLATQGSKQGKTTEYKIRYSYDGRVWYGYPNNASLQIFPGNLPSRGDNAIFANWLKDSITTKHIQLSIQNFKRFPCIRLELYGCKKDVAMPVIEQKSDSKSLNKTVYTTIVLECQIRGQAGMEITWERDGKSLQGSSFEKIKTEFPPKLVISAVTKTQININYENDRDLYDNFNCTGSRNNSRRLLCRSIYSCSASYPNATTSSQGNIPVIITPNIVLPDVPGKPSIINIKSHSAEITWRAAEDYLESQLERYVVRVSNENYTIKINVTSGIEQKYMTYILQNRTQYTSYDVSIAAVSSITVSNFTEEVTFLTLYGPYLILEEQSPKIVEINEKNITIPCTGRSYPTPSVIWKKDGKKIQLRENLTEASNNSTQASNNFVYQISTPLRLDNKSNFSIEITSTLFLRTNGIKYEDYGNYTCEVLNVNESSIPLRETIEIQFPPRITKGPSNMTVKEGENITLTCDGEGPPKPTFSWSIVSERVTIEEIISNNNELELRNVRSAGDYKFIVKCKASNKGGFRTANATTEILVKPRIINLTQSHIGLLYDDVRLTCEILANPPALIWWTKDGNTSHLSNVHFENGNKTLVITKAVLDNIGNYSCHASQNLYSTSASLILNLKVKPRILEHLEGDDVQNGTSYKLNCSAYGDPALKYSWTINGSQSIPNAIPINGNKTLHINPVTIENEGTYKCMVTNIEGNASTTANITVFARPKIINSPVDQTWNETDSVTFSCGGNGIPTPDISWTKDVGHELNNSSKYDIQNVHYGRYNFQTSNLTINSLTYADRGNYSCTLRNRKDEDVETAVLVVQVRPVATIDPNSVSVNITKHVTFTCKVYGFPKPQVSWMKNSLEIKNNFHYNTSRIYGNGSNLTWYSDFQIENVERDDTANYSCFLGNAAGTDIDYVLLVVLERPDPLNISTTNVTSRSVVVKWTADFDGNMDIFRYTLKYFIKGSESSTTMQKQLSSNVTLYKVTSLKPYSTYIFEMTATNEIGVSDVSNKSIDTLQDRPTSPQSVNVLAISSTSLNVTWQAPKEENGIILKYVIYHGRVGSDERHSIIANASERSKIITNLKPYTNYTIEMVASTSVGNGNRSDSKIARTNEAAPSSPRNLTLRVESNTTILVSWLPPVDKNGIIIEYIVQVRDQRVNSSERTVNVSGETTSILANLLKPYTNYTFRIRARTKAGWGNFSENETERTDEGLPSEPLDLDANVESNTAIQLSWSEPLYHNGIIRKYHVYYKKATENNVIGHSTTTAAQYLVQHLIPYTNYSFWVYAETSAGLGNKSVTIFNKTYEGVPSEPLNLDANVESNTTVQLSWSEPLYLNGIIRKYHVHYKKTTENNDTDHNTTMATEYLVQNLIPYTNYSFWVYAETSAGLGNKSVTILNKTYEGVPTEPQNVDANALSSTSINVTWLEPENTYGKIDRYVIYYQETAKENGYNETTVENGNRARVLTSLQVQTEYSISVQAFTSAGGGKWSETIKKLTEPGIPVAPGRPNTYEPTGKGYNKARMIAIKLPKFSNENGIITFYRVIVVMVDDTITNLAEIFKQPTQLLYQDWISKKNKIGLPYIAFAFKGNLFDKHENFIVGDDEGFDNTYRREKRETGTVHKNGNLVPGKQYAVALRGYTAENKYATSQYLKYSTEPAAEQDAQDTPVDTTVVVVIVVVAVILSALLLTAVWFRIKKNRGDHGDGQHNTVSGMRNLGHPVPLPEFRFYVQSKQFAEEYQDIPKVVDREASSSITDTNMQKNRYKNIIPYDYTRVRLHRDEGDDDTDYINASIIKGLKLPSKYIASQGPTPHTANDFWQMVWEQEVSIIVMLTGLEEKGTVKCYQYWPVNTDEQKYGNLTLKLTGETVLADFTTRYFEMKETDTGQIRLVQHLHFTAWPDHGVPKYPGPLLHFHKRYRSGLSGPEPVVVHCSAGVGRTGTFIAVDYILHKLDEERNNDPAIDILHFVREMRGQRMFMVQTEEQYRFIHHAILEAVTFPDTEISSTDIRVRTAILRETLPGSNKTKGREVFENLEKRILLEACEDGSSNDNQKKNRSKLLPFDYNRVHLNEMENSTDYINASYVCGYQYPVNFIATQHPLPHTVSDFWRMVHEQKSAIVLAISSKEEMDEFGSYWPEEGYASYGPINVGFEGKNEEFAASGFIVRNFKLTDTRDSIGRSFAVTHFNFVDWSPHNLPTASSMICLLAEIEKAQRKSQNTLVTVHCSDGGGRTGTFCAIVSCIERVKLENNIDLPMTLRNLHAQRKDMIQNEAQYIFCYDVISAFLASFDDQMYDNFKPSKVEEEEENYPETTMDGQNRLVSKF